LRRLELERAGGVDDGGAGAVGQLTAAVQGARGRRRGDACSLCDIGERHYRTVPQTVAQAIATLS
jgi:hypothetical protein